MKPAAFAFCAIFAGAMAAAQAAAPDPSAAHISGRLRDGATGQPVARWEVVISGPTLLGRENSALEGFTSETGEFEFEVPPGSYNLESIGGKYEESQFHLSVTAGAHLIHDFDLRPPAVSRAYRVENVELPRQMVPEVSGVTFTPGGSLVAVTRRGQKYVWIRSAGTAQWRRFAYGLFEAFGVVADSERSIYVTTRGQVMHLSDTTGSGEADLYQVVTDESGMTGNYHEFPYGLVRDRYGNFYGANGMSSHDGDNFKDVVAKGPLKLPKNVAGFSHDDHRSLTRYEGWVYEVTPQGVFMPLATGFRQALGIGLSPKDELFVTDISGSWVPTSLLLHVEKGHFYSHPDGLKWDPSFDGVTITPAMLRQMRTPPVVYVPRGPLGSGLGQPVWDTTGGKFGPFGGEIFICDWTGVVVRVDLEKVAGEYQGAVFLFLSGQGLSIGGIRETFGPDGSLYIGQTVRGWGSTAKDGLQRIVWTGADPVEIGTLRLTPRGFALNFTAPMNPASLAEAAHYRVKRFQYHYSIDDGSLPINEMDVPVTRATLHPDGRGVDIDLAELMPDYVYEVSLDGVRSQDGRAVVHPVGYYTANRLLAGFDYSTKSTLVARPVALGPPDPAAGKVIFQANCVICHQPDGRGSKQVGTPDFTLANGPLSLPDAPLINQIVNGGKVMPPFGNVLPRQDILNVLAFLREAFGPKSLGAARR